MRIVTPLVSTLNPDNILSLKKVHQDMKKYVKKEYEKRELETKEEYIQFLDEMNEVLEDRHPGAPFRVGMRSMNDKAQISLYNVSGRN